MEQKVKNIYLKKKYPSLLGSYFKTIDKLNEKEIIPLAEFQIVLLFIAMSQGYWSNYKSDQNGYNNSNQFEFVNVDVLLLGDPFVHGACKLREYNCWKPKPKICI